MKNQLLCIGMTVAALSFGRGTACAQLSMQEAASQGLLQPLTSSELPTFGTFWSWQTSAPFPYNPCPDCQAYALADGSGVLIDDRALRYDALQASGTVQLSGNGPQDGPPPDYGCGLWLESHIVNSVAQITLHNTVSGRTYKVWGTPDLHVPIANWTLKATVTATGDLTIVPVPVNVIADPILFFRASEVRDYAIVTSFDGVSATEVPDAAAPDSMGAVSGNRFVELINGRIRVFDKADNHIVAEESMNNFFTISENQTNYPTGRAIDPRIIYDASAGRWVACAIDVDEGTNRGSLQFLLAVSTNSSPDDLANGWRRHVVNVEPVRGLGEGLQAMGMDANGIYLDKITYTSPQYSHTNVAIKKSDLYNGTLTRTLVGIPNNPSGQALCIQPACNFDTLGTSGYTFLLAKGAPTSGASYQGGAIFYRKLQWNGSTAVLVGDGWVEITGGGHNYRDYFDLDLPGVSAPHFTPEGGRTVDLHTVGSELMPRVMVENGSLWLCHLIGLSGSSGTYSGNETGATVDRSGVQWFRLGADPINGSLTYLEHGRIYDTTASNAYWYYFPSVAVNCAGDMVAGFSGSSATSYIGAYYAWRPAGGAAVAPRLIRAGLDPYTASERWGDYSVVVVDPTDEWSFWTVQEYAGQNGANPDDFSWRTVIARIVPQP